jgi:23S rRNA pseudouridine1911/1915/1917 synthase
VRVDGVVARASLKLRAGSTVCLTVPEPPRAGPAAEEIPLEFLHLDEWIAAVNKPAGMVVHPAPGNWTGTLVNALMGRGQPLADAGADDRAGLVHRLDKDTSGLLVVAKTDRAHRALSAALAARRVTRRYAAVCWGHVDQDRLTVEAPLARDPKDRTRMAIVAAGKPARTDFTRLGRFDSVDLLRAHLHTGRTHQIRVHLASIGHPVIGDDIYGGGGGRRLAALPPHRHFLHAAWLRFRHPETGALLDLRAPLPADLRTSLVTISGMPELGTMPDPLTYFGFYDVDDVVEIPAVTSEMDADMDSASEE